MHKWLLSRSNTANMQSDRRVKRKTNPRQNANIFSKLTFWYTWKLFKKGFKKNLNEEDLYDVVPEFDALTLGNRIEQLYNSNQNQDRKNVLYLILWAMFGKSLLLLGLTRFIIIIFDVVRPILIGKLILYFTEQQSVTKSDAYTYALSLVGLQLFIVVYRHYLYFLLQCLEIKTRTAVCSLFYRKFLKLPASHLSKISIGRIINLITKDINAFENFTTDFTLGWTGCISTAIIFYSLEQKIGIAALVALVAFALIVPLQIFTSIWIASIKIKTSEKTDDRLNILQTVLANIRTIKMYVWEKFHIEKITEARNAEVALLFKMTNIFFFTVTLATAVASIAYYFLLMTYIWLNNFMSAETMYFTTQSFGSMSFYLITGLNYGFFYSSQVLAAIKRMQKLITDLDILEEIEPNFENPSISFKQVTINVLDKTVFEKVDFDIASGLTIISGPTGSGKSLLLLTILKEFKADGVLTSGKVSYASEKPWFFPSTIRQNILFGSTYNHEKYQQVIQVCALEHDMESFEKKDLTMISDQGLNLSKGQKSRINLARAVYRDSDIYLLDDCLSSLDPLVAKHIFTNCVLKYLKDKIVVLVTNNTKLNLCADLVLKINGTNVAVQKNDQPVKILNVDEDLITDIDTETESFNEEIVADVKTELIDTKTNKMFSEENKKGTVSLKVYKAYIGLGGGIIFFISILVIFILHEIAFGWKAKVISQWANIEEEIHLDKLNSSLLYKRSEILKHYTACTITSILLTFIRAYVLFIFSKKISINLHNKMVKSVLNAQLKFFDFTNIGNIINRFSKDLITVDENVPFILLHLTAIVFQTAGHLFLISTTSTRCIAPILITITCVFVLRYFYLKVGRPLKRLEASTKSPVIGYLNATLEGLPIIKSSKAEAKLLEEFEACQNIYTSASYLYLSASRAFVLAADFFIAIAIGFIILQFVVFDQGVLPGDVGLAISQVFLIGDVLHYALYKWIQVDTLMTSIERALEYTELEQEAKTGLNIENWPQNSEIVYSNLYLAIKNIVCLKNINFVIKKGEKTAIVGRTGAGKSSIISSLFRLYETEGKISIDGIDIKTLSLPFLRASISVFPQDVYLFDGTLRCNLDPVRKHDDNKLCNALEIVALKHLTSFLDENVNNLNLSCSHRQLICLARIFLRNNKIVVFDEMVEQIDSETKKRMNEIFESKFADCTVIKITHIIESTLGYDQVLVVHDGRIVESGVPEELLENEDSLFYKMVEMSK